MVLQVGVQAGEMPRTGERPRELLLAIDTSTSMSAGRLEATRTALDRLIERLNAGDRAAIVSFNDTVSAPSSWHSPQQRQRWHRAVADLSAGGAGDFGRGLMAAAEEIIERADETAEAERRLVLLTDTDWECEPSQMEALGQVTAELTRRGIPLHVVHLGPTGESRRQLTALAQSTGGECHAAGATHEIGRAFGLALLGSEPTIATDVEFTLRFDPKQVAAYRLLGDHAPSIVAGDAEPSVSLAAGEGVVAVYEIWLDPNAAGTPITAEASWRNALTQRQVTRRTSLSVGDLVVSSAEVSESLWLASLAIATTDSLRRPANVAEMKTRLTELLEVAREDRPALSNRADVQRIIRLLENSLESISND